MFTWASIVLAVLQAVNAIMGFVNTEKAQQAGVDAEIARVSAAILAKTQAGKAIMEKVNALSNDDVDNQLIGLEPK